MFDFREHRRKQRKVKLAERRIRARLRAALRAARAGFVPFIKRAAPIGLILTLVLWAAVTAATGGLFRVREVRINGIDRVPRSEVIGLMGLTSDQNLLSVDADELRARLRKSPWIRDAEVDFELPDRLVVRVEEQRILAVIRLEHDYYVNDEGIPFKRVEPGESRNYSQISGFAAADFTSGDPAALEDLAAAVGLIRIASGCGLKEINDLSEVRFDRAGGFSLILDSGVWIDLGRGGFEEKVDRLARLWSSLGEDAARLIWIDLSSPGKAFLRMNSVGGRV